MYPLGLTCTRRGITCAIQRRTAPPHRRSTLRVGRVQGPATVGDVTWRTWDRSECMRQHAGSVTDSMASLSPVLPPEAVRLNLLALPAAASSSSSPALLLGCPGTPVSTCDMARTHDLIRCILAGEVANVMPSIVTWTKRFVESERMTHGSGPLRRQGTTGEQTLPLAALIGKALCRRWRRPHISICIRSIVEHQQHLSQCHSAVPQAVSVYPSGLTLA